jgi:hypothetical protein
MKVFICELLLVAGEAEMRIERLDNFVYLEGDVEA